MLILSRYVLLASEFALTLGACAIFFTFLKVAFS
jgi:hypothetical protein